MLTFRLHAHLSIILVNINHLKCADRLLLRYTGFILVPNNHLLWLTILRIKTD